MLKDPHDQIKKQLRLTKLPKLLLLSQNLEDKDPKKYFAILI